VRCRPVSDRYGWRNPYVAGVPISYDNTVREQCPGHGLSIAGRIVRRPAGRDDAGDAVGDVLAVGVEVGGWVAVIGGVAEVRVVGARKSATSWGDRPG